jgi:hypothetical protein
MEAPGPSFLSRLPAPLPQRFDESPRIGVVGKGFVHVREEVDVAGREDEASTELERMLTELTTPEARSGGTSPAASVVPAQQMEDIRPSQADRVVGLSLSVDQQREINTHLAPELRRVASVAQAHCGDPRAPGFDLLSGVANPRDVLSTEDSAVVAQEDHDRRSLRPERAQAHDLAVRVG